MRHWALLAVLLLTVGCKRLDLYTPEVMVRPGVVGHGAHFSVRLYGAEVADYKFMGATKEDDGTWKVRLDLVWLGLLNQESLVTIREGDVLPLGPSPSVNVKFLSISPTELEITAVGVRTNKGRY